MGFPSIISQAQLLILDTLREGEVAIDATVGNGVDTLFLARAVGPRGKVYAFDIQSEAIASARQRFQREQTDDSVVEWLCRSHAEMKEAVGPDYAGKVGAILFNLGYLPGGDPSVITRPESTLPALEASLPLLRTRGVLAIVVYPGHPGGDEEAALVESWAKELPPNLYQTVKYAFLNPQQPPPYLIGVCRR